MISLSSRRVLLSPVPSIMRLKAAGVRVGGGCDGIRDTWGPWGQPDMLDRAEGDRDEERPALGRGVGTSPLRRFPGGADVMRLEDYGIKTGCNADLTLLTGETLAHAVVDVAPRPLVIKRGRVTARQGQALVEMP